MPFTMPGKKRPIGGGSAPVSSEGGSAAAPAAPQQSSPGYVNFSRLLAVNQGGAQRMADNLAGQVQQKGSEAQSQIQGARQGFQGQVQAGTQHFTAPAAGAGGTNSASLYAQAGALSAQAKNGYSGPKDWGAAGYDTVAMSGKAKDAQQAAQGLTTAGGRGAMLREQAGGPYSAGMSALDASLSGAALGSRGKDLSALYGNLSQQLVDYQKEGGAAVDAATTESNAASQQYTDEARRYQTLGEQAQSSEEAAKAYQEEMRRRYPRGNTGGDPRLSPFIPGLYG